MKIIYFYHIPKCGGSSLDFLFKKLAHEKNGEYYGFNEAGNIASLTKFKKLKNNYRLNKFLKNINNKTTDYKFIHHHHGYYGIAKIYDKITRAKEIAEKKGHEFYLFTTIREPMSFLISKTNYAINHNHNKKINFERVCNMHRHHNVMYKYLLYNSTKLWPKQMNLDKAYFDKHCDIFDKIFTLENIEELYQWLEEIIESPIHEIRKDNVGKHLLLPTEEQRIKLKEVNQLDQYFYDKYK